MMNGNINQYVTARPYENRFELVSSLLKLYVPSAAVDN